MLWAQGITSQTTRGFTGEEELQVAGLVHLNGRVYDPLLARFTSADTITENPYSTQGWNRYSYVGNDPLAFTDPSGHCFLGCFWKAIGNFFAQNPIARAILQIGITAILTAVLSPFAVFAIFGNAAAGVAGAAAAFGGAAIATGLSGGNFSQVLRAGLIAGATAFAFFEIGGATNVLADQSFDAPHIQPAFGTDAYAFNVAGHALVGCAQSAASGGSCGAGALSGAAGAAAGPALAGPDFSARLVATAVIGGAASVAGGGKFANGAITGAFGYLFNSQGGRISGWVIGGIFGALLTGPENVPLEYLTAHLGAELGDWLTGPDTPSEAFHYTNSQYLSSIVANGLRPGSYATDTGNLSPLQAQIDLALPPNRDAPDTLLRIDLDGLRAAGYDVPTFTQATRNFNMPGGGNEIQFPYAVPPKFISVVK